MPRGVADIVEVVVLAAGAHAFLRRGGAQIGALLDAGEDVLELHHAGIGEHQGRVVARHQAATTPRSRGRSCRSNSRNADLISLTPLMSVQSHHDRLPQPAGSPRSFPAPTLLDAGGRAVQKCGRGSEGCRRCKKTR